MIHELKTWPEPFDAVRSGAKTHEVRKADRPFQAGDVLRLREFAPHDECFGTGRVVDHTDTWPCCPIPHGRYTGLEIYVYVSHVTQAGTWGLPAGVCVMSIQIMTPEQIELELGVEGVRRHQEQRDGTLRATLGTHPACLSDCRAPGCCGGCRT